MCFMIIISVLVFMRLQLTAFKPHTAHKLTYHISGQLDVVFISMSAMLPASAERFESLNIWRINALYLTVSRLIAWATVPFIHAKKLE